MNTDSLDLVKNIHNRKIVELIYRTMLGRDPDVDRIAHHCKRLQNGGLVDKIIRDVQASDEYINRNISASRDAETTHADEVPGMGPTAMGPHAKRIYLELQSGLSKKKENR